MRNFTHRWPQSGHFFSKLEQFFPFFEKGQGKPPPHPPLVTRLQKNIWKLIYNQLYDYFDGILFPSQCGFRNGYSTQHCLLVMLEKFKESVDKGNEFGALLTDLSKAFDFIDHKLICKTIMVWSFTFVT